MRYLLKTGCLAVDSLGVAHIDVNRDCIIDGADISEFVDLLLGE